MSGFEAQQGRRIIRSVESIKKLHGSQLFLSEGTVRSTHQHDFGESEA